ncbi:MAG: hypothetical protein COW65_03580 [Cytophagales bacterium CG18_big_fil_WC_8_21_14_2_50_42_9]|nr:MAG: hypothetical protein COW65_03580 [Cytophagales bacterium CG18_big_fil_WC_8_21_14_2_50_42_9]
MSQKDVLQENIAATDKNKSAPSDPYVIGIGASAGGLQALDSLFKNVPRDSVAYVIVQHLAPEHRSILTEILKKYSNLTFTEAQHDQPVQMNYVYIVPTGKYLTIEYNHLKLTDRSAERSSSRTIDNFLKSLAQDKGPKAIGIILSGTGSDGSEGVLAIKKHGGLVLVQDPETAKFDGMPRSALNTGKVDFVLPPELMPDEIFNYVKVVPLTQRLTEVVQSEEPAFQNILDLVRDRTGSDFTYYKRPTLIRRISRRMAITNTSSFVNYLDYLQLHPEEVETLSKEFLIGVTKFFRDAEAFDVIAKQVLPNIVEGKNAGEQLRIWVAACASGEEAYSLAILVREYLDLINKELEVKVFASDIDRDAIDSAGTGIYPEGSLTEIPAEYREKYFVEEEGKFRIAPRIRRMVIFAQHNVINDPPFSRMDLVSCRNMLIYLSPQLQNKVIGKFHYALQVGGYLFLGPSESLGEFTDFAEVHKKWRIFRNTTPARTLGLESFTTFKGINFKKTEIELPLRNRDLTPRQKILVRLSEILNDAVLEEFSFAAVWVDENYDVLHSFGDYRKYLTLPETQFTYNILKMVPPDMALNLGAALRRAVRDKEKVNITGIPVRKDQTIRYFNLVVKPYFSEKKLYERFILVLFHEETSQEITTNAPLIMSNEIHFESRVHELEIELQNSKEDLQGVVEELETSNEELQSTNEELLSSNEELQSANEELQSLNEELNTINAEHQYKIKMLMELDDDLNNFFRSSDIGQIFIDRHLVIRRFTPATTQLINLIETDIGRPIIQITHNINHPDFMEDIRNVINHSVILEREVQDKNGIWFLMRILPYITLDRLHDGAIILFVNIHELKNLHLMQASILDSSPNAILTLKAVPNNINIIVDFECTLLNSRAEEILGIAENDLLNKSLSQSFPALLYDGLFGNYINVVQTGCVLNIEKLVPLSPDKNCWLQLFAVKLDHGLVLSILDISERKQNEQQLLQQQEEIWASAERFRVLLEAVPHITWTKSPLGEATSFNNLWYSYTGLTSQESLGWGWQKAFHPDDLKKVTPVIENALTQGFTFGAEARMRHGSETNYRWHLVKVVPCRNENGQIYMWVGTATEIQELKDAEEANIELHLQQQKDILTTILKTQEDERIRISESLHNGLGQILYAAKLNLTELNVTSAPQKKIKASIEKLLDEAITSARNISFELTPSILKDFGMKTALEELIRRISSKTITITCEVVGFEERPRYEIELALYRIIQELLNNIMKHAQATEAFIELVNHEEELYLHVQDNGVGFNTDFVNQGTGLGLNSIRNRVQLLNGTLHIDSRPGQGTVFRIEINK